VICSTVAFEPGKCPVEKVFPALVEEPEAPAICHSFEAFCPCFGDLIFRDSHLLNVSQIAFEEVWRQLVPEPELLLPSDTTALALSLDQRYVGHGCYIPESANTYVCGQIAKAG
jgi:hypothetical protein